MMSRFVPRSGPGCVTPRSGVTRDEGEPGNLVSGDTAPAVSPIGRRSASGCYRDKTQAIKPGIMQQLLTGRERLV